MPSNNPASREEDPPPHRPDRAGRIRLRDEVKQRIADLKASLSQVAEEKKAVQIRLASASPESVQAEQDLSLIVSKMESIGHQINQLQGSLMPGVSDSGQSSSLTKAMESLTLMSPTEPQSGAVTSSAHSSVQELDCRSAQPQASQSLNLAQILAVAEAAGLNPNEVDMAAAADIQGVLLGIANRSGRSTRNDGSIYSKAESGRLTPSVVSNAMPISRAASIRAYREQQSQETFMTAQDGSVLPTPPVGGQVPGRQVRTLHPEPYSEGTTPGLLADPPPHRQEQSLAHADELERLLQMQRVIAAQRIILDQHGIIRDAQARTPSVRSAQVNPVHPLQEEHWEEARPQYADEVSHQVPSQRQAPSQRPSVYTAPPNNPPYEAQGYEQYDMQYQDQAHRIHGQSRQQPVPQGSYGQQPRQEFQNPEPRVSYGHQPRQEYYHQFYHPGAGMDYIPTQSPMMQQVTVPMTHLMEEKALLSPVKWNNNDFPEFVPTQGLMIHTRYARKWGSSYSTYRAHLEGNVVLQHSTLMSTLKSADAKLFLKTHTEKIIRLCMEPDKVRALLEVGTGDQSALSQGKQFAKLEMLSKNGYRQVDSVRVPDYTPSHVVDGGSLPAHVVSAVMSSHNPDTSQTDRVPLIWAFLHIVEKELCKALPEELKVWENEMKMGVSNLFDTVLQSETPQEFLNRIMRTYNDYTRFAEHEFRRTTKKDPRDVFLHGIPKRYRQVAEDKLADMGISGTTQQEQLLEIAKKVSNHHAYNVESEARAHLWSQDKAAPVQPTRGIPAAPTRPANEAGRPYSRFTRKVQVHTAAALAAQGIHIDPEQIVLPDPQQVTAAGHIELVYPASMHPRGSKAGRGTDTAPTGGRGNGVQSSQPGGRGPPGNPSQSSGGRGDTGGRGGRGGQPQGGRGQARGDQPRPPCWICTGAGITEGADDHGPKYCPYAKLSIQGVIAAKQAGNLPPRASGHAQAPPPAPPLRPAGPPPRPVANAGMFANRRPPQVAQENDYDEGDGQGYAPRNTAHVNFAVASASSFILQGQRPGTFLAEDVSTVKTNPGDYYDTEGSFPKDVMREWRYSASAPMAGTSRTENPSSSLGGLSMPMEVSSYAALAHNTQGCMSMMQPPSAGLSRTGSFPLNANLSCVNDSSAFCGLVVAQPTDSAEVLTLMGALKHVQTLKANNASDSEIEVGLTIFESEVAKIVSGLCNKEMSAVSAGVRSESYTKDTKKTFPTSFIPKIPTELPPSSRASKSPGGLQSQLGCEIQAPHLSSAPPVNLPQNLPPQNFEEISFDKPLDCLSAPSIDLRRSVATAVDNSQVNPTLKEKRPESFRVDESKLGPSYKQYGFDWVFLKEDQSKDVDTFVSKNAISLQAIPSGSIPGSNSRVSTRDLIDRYVSDLSGKLSFLATSAQVGLVYNGVKHLEPKMMLDWGSNVCLVDDKWCREKGIDILPTALRLTLASSSTDLVGITPVLTLSYGSGPQAFTTRHAFLVVKHNPKGPFRVLIGNRDAMQFGGIQDLGANTLSYRPEWDTKGLKSPLVSFPLTSSHP